MKIKTFSVELGLELMRNILEIQILADRLKAKVNFFPDSACITARFNDEGKDFICTSVNETFDYNVKQVHGWLTTRAKAKGIV